MRKKRKKREAPLPSRMAPAKQERCNRFAPHIQGDEGGRIYNFYIEALSDLLLFPEKKRGMRTQEKWRLGRHGEEKQRKTLTVCICHLGKEALNRKGDFP